jgi:hypothetical protein
MSQGIRLKWGVRTMLSLVLLEALVSTHICYLKKEIRKCGADSPVRLLQPTASATDRWTKKQVHCVYQAQIVAIATRHADAVDYKFLVDGRKVWVALPHPAWVEYHKRTGTMITDSLGVEIAGHYLKSALEAGEGLGREMYSLTVEETLKHLDAAVAEMQAQPA